MVQHMPQIVAPHIQILEFDQTRKRDIGDKLYPIIVQKQHLKACQILELTAQQNLKLIVRQLQRVQPLKALEGLFFDEAKLVVTEVEFGEVEASKELIGLDPLQLVLPQLQVGRRNWQVAWHTGQLDIGAVDDVECAREVAGARALARAVEGAVALFEVTARARFARALVLVGADESGRDQIGPDRLELVAQRPFEAGLGRPGCLLEQ